VLVQALTDAVASPRREVRETPRSARLPGERIHLGQAQLYPSCGRAFTSGPGPDV